MTPQETHSMTIAKTLFAAAAALAAGAAAMYYLDPQNGRRRRALVADRVDAARHDAARLAAAKSRRAADRARGLAAQLRSHLPGGHHEAADDGQIEGRVRAQLGRVIGYPKAIHTTVEQGCVRLDGHVLEKDLEPLLSELKSVPGVRRIYNRLEVHENPEHDPALQGARVYQGRRRKLARPLWSALAIAAPIALAIGAAQRYNGGQSLRR